MHNIPTATPLTPPRRTNNNGDDILLPAAQPPFRRWVNLYGEEICKVNTHKTATKKTSNSPATLNYTLESKRAPVEVMKPFNNIHGSGFVRESLRGIPPAAGTVGLHNLGNSCYMVSVLCAIRYAQLFYTILANPSTLIFCHIICYTSFYRRIQYCNV